MIKVCAVLVALVIIAAGLIKISLVENGGGGVRIELKNEAIHSMQITSGTADRMTVVKFFQNYALARGFSCLVTPMDPEAKMIQVELAGPGFSVNSLNAFREMTFDTALYAEPPKPENKPAVDALAENLAAAAQSTDGITVSDKK